MSEFSFLAWPRSKLTSSRLSAANEIKTLVFGRAASLIFRDTSSDNFCVSSGVKLLLPPPPPPIILLPIRIVIHEFVPCKRYTHRKVPRFLDRKSKYRECQAARPTQ